MSRKRRAAPPARRGRRALGSLVAKLIVLGFFLVLYLPIAWMLTMAFKRRVDITAMPPRIFFTPILTNFEWLFVHQDMIWPIIRSVLVALGSVGIALALGSMAAYALSRARWWRQQDIEFFIISTRMLPPIALILPYYAIWIQFRLFDNLVALAFVYLAINLPLVIWLMLGYFRSIPVEIDEAARVDGCSLIGSFWYIALPVSKGGLTVAAILGFIYTWGELFFAYLLTAVNKTVPVALASFMVVGLDVRYGEMAAAGTLAAIPSLILTIIARNSLVSGFRSLAGLR